MITGRQIREARKLLKLDLAKLGGLADLPVELIERAEKNDATPAITLAQGRKLEAALSGLGAVFHWSGSVTVKPATKPSGA